MDTGTADHLEGEDHEPHQTSGGGTAAILQTRPRPPVSAPARTSSGRQECTEPSGSHVTAKPRSTGYPTRPLEASSPHTRNAVPYSPRSKHSEAETVTLECPICGKTMETDNQALNSHIDFCLSRGAIMTAQSKAKSPVKGLKSWEHKNTKTTDAKRQKG
jgi:DNA polymerase kappa